MRTTLTLDDDLAAKLHEEARRSGQPLKQVVNDVLRIGLKSQAKSKDFPPFKVEARPLGLRPEFSYDCTGKLLEQLDEIEGKSYR